MTDQTWLGAIDIGFLSEGERRMIMEVMQRDEKLRLTEQYRITQLRNTLRHMRRKGARQAERSYSVRACGRCSARTGLLFHSAVQCIVCKHKVCEGCRQSTASGEWKCVVCHREAKLKAETGDWFYDAMRAELKTQQAGPEILKEAVVKKPRHFSTSSSTAQPMIAYTAATTSDSSSHLQPSAAPVRQHTSRSRSSNYTEDTSSSTESQRHNEPKPHHRRPGPAETGSIKSLRESRPTLSESEYSTTSSVASATRHTLPRTAKQSNYMNEPKTIESYNMPITVTQSHTDVSSDFKFHGVESQMSEDHDHCEHSDDSSMVTEDRFSDISTIARNIQQHPEEQSFDSTEPHTFELMPSPEEQHKPVIQPSPKPRHHHHHRRHKNKNLTSLDRQGSKGSVNSRSSKGSLFKRLNPLVKHREISMSTPAINTPSKHLHQHPVTAPVEIIEETQDGKHPMYTFNREKSSSLPGFAKSMSSFGGSSYMHDISITGEVRFSLNYNHKANVLMVNIAECRNIATADVKRKRSDPYVKCYLLPDRAIKRKTVTKKHTTCPVYNQCLKFQVSYSELSTRVLQLSVWNAGTFSRNLFLGQVLFPLDTWEVQNTNENWYPLRNREAMTEDLLHATVYKGDLVVGLKFTEDNTNKKGKQVTRYGFLDVMVHQAKNLTPARANGSVDAFVRISLKPDKQYKEKTSVVSKTTSPVWNAQFHIPLNQPMEESSLQLIVCHKDKLSANTVLGACRLNLGPGHALVDEYGAALRPPAWMDATDKECDIWRRAIDNPETWVDDTLMLRPTL